MTVNTRREYAQPSHAVRNVVGSCDSGVSLLVAFARATMERDARNKRINKIINEVVLGLRLDRLRRDTAAAIGPKDVKIDS